MHKIQQLIFGAFLDEEEKILYVAHRHIFIHLKIFIRTIFFGFLIPGLFYIFFPEAQIFWISWLILGVLFFIYNFLDWYYDAWVFTNMGLLSIEWNGFFDRSSTRIDYQMIEGISYSVRGITQTIFNYGDVVIERIGSASALELRDAYRPRKVEKKFSHFHNHYTTMQQYSNHETLKGLLSEMLHQHIQDHGVPKKDQKK